LHFTVQTKNHKIVKSAENANVSTFLAFFECCQECRLARQPISGRLLCRLVRLKLEGHLEGNFALPSGLLSRKPCPVTKGTKGRLFAPSLDDLVSATSIIARRSTQKAHNKFLLNHGGGENIKDVIFPLF